MLFRSEEESEVSLLEEFYAQNDFEVSKFLGAISLSYYSETQFIRTPLGQTILSLKTHCPY